MFHFCFPIWFWFGVGEPAPTSGPHSLVHGDLRLTSLLLSAQTDAKTAPQLVLADLGLAGLPAAPPPLEKPGEGLDLGLGGENPCFF